MKIPMADYRNPGRVAGPSAFFRSLAAYSRAGITLDRGLSDWAARLPRHKRIPFQLTAQQVQGGQTLAHAGLKNGVLQSWEARLLAIASLHGRLDRVLDELASYHEQASDWWKRLRQRLLFPGGILVLGFLALPLPGLITGQLSVYTYLLQNLLLAAALLAVRGLPGTRRRRYQFPDMILRCKSLSKPVWQHQRYRFLHQLACLYNAGVTMLDALPIAASSCDSALLRSRWSMIEAEVRQGSGISEALYRHAALGETGYALVLSGEVSGRLGEMLDHETRRLGQDVDLWLNGLVDWLPRLAYILVLLLLFSVWHGA
jgi:type II secretory pathway component PulF